MRYILASASPRRKELFARMGLPFEVIPSNKEEHITSVEPEDIVRELSAAKAKDIYEQLDGKNNCTVIGADTIVVYRGEILGKPTDKEDAFNMISLLSDRTHSVYTGVTLIINKGGKETVKSFHEKTNVTLYPISREDIHRYVDSGDPMDKAGAYGIQGDFCIHVKKIHGDYNNVVGLPVAHLYQELMQL